MTSTIGLTEAAAALKDHFGPRLETGHDEGLRLMAEVLQERLSVSRRQANGLVRDLEQGRSVRWVAERETPTPGVGSGTGLTVGWELPIPAPTEEGYWQL